MKRSLVLAVVSVAISASFAQAAATATSSAASIYAAYLKSQFGSDQAASAKVSKSLKAASEKIDQLRPFLADGEMNKAYRLRVLNSEIRAANAVYANTGNSVTDAMVRTYFESKLGELTRAVENQNKKEILLQLSDVSAFVKTTKTKFEN